MVCEGYVMVGELGRGKWVGRKGWGNQAKILN